ncbi:MAG TPA: putative glycoside hydrolase, partial [Longimicrobiales bacterium]
GHRWTDALGRAAVDVTGDDACDFLADIARAAARAGVDEVMLDELEVPPAAGGAPGRVLASSRHDRPAHAAVTACVRRVAATVRRAHAILGVAVPGRLCTDVGSAGLNGQRWEDLALAADRLSPEIYPHSVPSSAGGRMTAQPYQAVSTVVAMCYTRNLRLIKALAGRPVRVARIEPWIQAYSSRGVSYGPRALAEQLRGLREHGVGNALLWNGESDYDRFTAALHGPAPTRVVAYNPTAAQWARANRAPMVVGK